MIKENFMREPKEYCFTKDFEVRDSEVDLFGVVNNSVYMNYLEHARHCFLKSMDINVAAVIEKGYIPVVAECNLKYRSPLKSGDNFIVKLGIGELTKHKIIFIEDIYKYPEMELVLSSWFKTTVVHKSGRIIIPDEFREKLQRFLL